MSLSSFFFETGCRRKLGGWVGHAVQAFAAAVALWTVHAAAFSRADTLSLTITFLSLMLMATFLLVGPSPRAPDERVMAVDAMLAVTSAVVSGYFYLQSDTIAQRITLLDPLSPFDITFATLILLLTLEAMRRTVGMGLTVIVLAFVAYNLFGDRIGGILGHGVITYRHFLDITVFTTDGLFGVPLRVAATYAFLFVLFGTALAKAGGSQFFYSIAAYITGATAGGPAKIAVISSGLYGTISGSPTSDVVTTGAVTIPMMRRMGYSRTYAAAVEVAASTGGSFLPPVMGAAAFIMAEYTGIAYVDIAFAALIPALLYYVPVFTQVHLRAKREDLGAIDRSEIPELIHILRDGGLFVLPLGVIVWALVEGYTPTYTAIYGLAAIFAVSSLRRSTRLGPRAIYEILAETTLRSVAVAGACAAAGMVIGGITMTGLATKFSSLIFLLAGSDVFISIFLAAVLSLVLGMGMPTPSAFILAAVLVSPVIRTLGIDPLAGRLFLLYFACMSALTPPVAVAAYAASALADENPLKIAAQSLQIAIGAFLLPFSFVFNPALLLQGTVLEIISAAASVFAGLVLVAVAIEGYWQKPLDRLARLLLLAAGILCLFVDIVLLGIALTLLIAAWVRGRFQRQSGISLHDGR